MIQVFLGAWVFLTGAGFVSCQGTMDARVEASAITITVHGCDAAEAKTISADVHMLTTFSGNAIVDIPGLGTITARPIEAMEQQRLSGLKLDQVMHYNVTVTVYPAGTTQIILRR